MPVAGRSKSLDTGLGNGAKDCNANAIPDPDGTGFMVCGTEQNRMGFNHNLSRSWDDVAGKVSLSFALNDNNNIYALYSEGFKAGGLKRIGCFPLRVSARYAGRRAERVGVPDRVMMKKCASTLPSSSPGQLSYLPRSSRGRT